jgi:formylglycine-generating enzyme required for sulfatase activity
MTRIVLLLGFLGLTACLPDLDKPETGLPDTDADADTDTDADTDSDADADADTDADADADADTDADTDTDNPVDGDSDGFTVAEGDCDDGDPLVHPEAQEICNGVDDDCDELIDDADTSIAYGSEHIWYADTDGDGWGDPKHSKNACTDPTGFVGDGTDCDDGDANIHPEAVEECYDGVDQDCSGGSDYDCDGDGLDSSEHGGTDCADADAALYPGALSDHEGISMSYVCPGSFDMGSPVDEEGRDTDELQAAVALTGGFYIGTFPVTQLEAETLTGHVSAYDGCDDCPAESMSWCEAAEMANALSALAGLDPCYDVKGPSFCNILPDYTTPYECTGYRLPTEAEWEYAARAGTTSAFSCGGDLDAADVVEVTDRVQLSDGTWLDDISWYGYAGYSQPQAVAGKLPNPWGLYDMHGNIKHFVDGQYAAAIAAGDDPWVPWSIGSTAVTPVLRGGSVATYPKFIRSASRSSVNNSNGAADIGFRLALSE